MFQDHPSGEYSVRYVVVEPDNAGQRIDNWLLGRLKGAPRSYVYRILRSGEVRINKGRVKPGYRIQAGDRVRLPPMRLTARAKDQHIPESLIEQLNAAVIFENQELLVLNKPAGLAVHGGSGLNYGIIDVLRRARSQTTALELVHRLDRDTSGCLLIAKSRLMLTMLHDLFRGDRIEKRYLALIEGQWRQGSHTIRIPLETTRSALAGSKVRTSDTGKYAETEICPLQIYNDCSLVDVGLKTGRTHQIRVHMAHLRHPVAGDRKYGNFAFNRKVRGIGLTRMFLHASHLRFVLPESARSYEFTAPLDPVLDQALKKLELHQ